MPNAPTEKLALYERRANGELQYIGRGTTVPAGCRGYRIPWGADDAPVIDHAPETEVQQ